MSAEQGRTVLPILTVNDVEAAYAGIVVALRGVSLEVPEGGFVALLGSNGAGKTTTLKALSGLLAAEGGTITSGTVSFRSRVTTHATARDLVRNGLVQVLEGRRCFPHFTVEENLRAGGLAHRLRGPDLRRAIERVYAYFPRLAEVRRTPAGYTSGGEQQMVALGRALIARPRLLLLDEPSMGLAPAVTDQIFCILRTLNRDDGTSFLVAEQNARLALRHADHGYVLKNGRVATSGTAAELAARDDVRHFYLGVDAADVHPSRARRLAAAGSPASPA